MLVKNFEFQKNKENQPSNIKSKKKRHKKNYFNSSSKNYQIEEKEISSPKKMIYNQKLKENPEYEEEYKGLMCHYTIKHFKNIDNIHYNEKEKLEEFNNFRTKWKTEICRNWEMYGECKYGNNCSFAHGDSELKQRKISFNYKTKPCKQFFELGYCSYGIRCQFSHKKNDFLRDKNEKNGIFCDNNNKISYLKIIKEFLSDDNNNISLELVKRPRLKTFENITRCSLQESENSKLQLYEDIINIKNNILNNKKNVKKINMKYSEDSYYTNFSSDNNEMNNDNND